jgi:hypothetical protein
MKGFNFLVDAKTARISESYALKQGISQDEAMKLFLGSSTYRVLNDERCGVYLEVFEYVYDMFLEEMNISELTNSEMGEAAHEA